MGFLGFGKKDRILDLSERYKKQQEKIIEKKSQEANSQNSSPQGAFSLFDNLASSNTPQSDYVSISGDEKKKKLAKRLLDMTNKIEDLSNQIYHMKQRIEVLEKKLKINFE